MSRALDGLKWPAIVGLACAVGGALVGARMQQNHDFYDPKPNDYTPFVSKTPDGAAKLQKLVAKLHGQMLFEDVSTTEFMEINGCQVPAGTPLRQLTITSSGGPMGGGAIQASAKLPRDLCLAKGESPYSNHNDVMSNTPFGIPLWALPLDDLYERYVAVAPTEPMRYPGTTGWHSLLPDAPNGLHVFRRIEISDPDKRKYLSEFAGIPTRTTEIINSGTPTCPPIPIGTPLQLKGFVLNYDGDYLAVVAFPASLCNGFFKGRTLYFPERATATKHDTPLTPAQRAALP